MQLINQYGPQYAKEYQYQSPEFKTLTGGDYDRLEQNIVASRTAPLERAWSLRKGDINQEMSDRGLWSSGAPIQQQGKEFEQSFLPAYQQAGAEAAAQRYGMQADETMKGNAFASEEANRAYNSKWRVPEFIGSAWSGNQGQVSHGSQSGGGWNFSI